MKTTTSFLRRGSLAALAAFGLIGVGCGTASEAAPGAPVSTSTKEIPGTHAANDLDPVTAQRFIDRVRVGRELDANGKVPAVADRFTESDSIYVAMEVTDAPAGSAVRLQVLDDTTDREVWTHEKTVDAGKSHLSFAIAAGKLPRGDYKARIIIGDETVANRTFTVSRKSV